MRPGCPGRNETTTRRCPAHRAHRPSIARRVRSAIHGLLSEYLTRVRLPRGRGQGKSFRHLPSRTWAPPAMTAEGLGLAPAPAATTIDRHRSPSFSGLGHRPFKAAARVRIPLGIPTIIGPARQTCQPGPDDSPKRRATGRRGVDGDACEASLVWRPYGTSPMAGAPPDLTAEPARGARGTGPVRGRVRGQLPESAPCATSTNAPASRPPSWSEHRPAASSPR